jgi:hypothetical protein
MWREPNFERSCHFCEEIVEFFVCYLKPSIIPVVSFTKARDIDRGRERKQHLQPSEITHNNQRKGSSYLIHRDRFSVSAACERRGKVGRESSTTFRVRLIFPGPISFETKGILCIDNLEKAIPVVKGRT